MSNTDPRICSTIERFETEHGWLCIIRRIVWDKKRLGFGGALPACLAETFQPHFMGYVRVPDGHPLNGQPEPDWLDMPGGVTWCGDDEGLGPGWWYGFDTAHPGTRGMTQQECHMALLDAVAQLVANYRP